jgi:Short C-terminal domain
MMRRGVGRVGRPGLVGTMARTAVVAGTATAVAGGVSRHQQGKAQDKADAAAYQEQQEMAQQQAMADQAAANAAAQQAAAAPAEDPTVTKIKELAGLHEQGILSDEEFASAKAKLLA